MGGIRFKLHPAKKNKTRLEKVDIYVESAKRFNYPNKMDHDVDIMVGKYQHGGGVMGPELRNGKCYFFAYEATVWLVTKGRKKGAAIIGLIRNPKQLGIEDKDLETHFATIDSDGLVWDLSSVQFYKRDKNFKVLPSKEYMEKFFGVPYKKYRQRMKSIGFEIVNVESRSIFLQDSGSATDKKCRDLVGLPTMRADQYIGEQIKRKFNLPYRKSKGYRASGCDYEKDSHLKLRVPKK